MKTLPVKNYHRFQHGFSLPELIITMAIASIFAGLAIVTFSRNLREESLKAAARQTTTWLEDLRKLAIQNDIPCPAEVSNTNAILQVKTDSNQPLFERCIELNYASLAAKSLAKNLNDLILCSKALQNGESASDTIQSLSLSCNTGSNSTVFTPRGTSTDSLLITLSLPGLARDRCIAVLAPNGLIRNGITKGGACEFTTSY